MSDNSSRLVHFAALDGVSLVGKWFYPPRDSSPPTAVLVVAGGGGIPAAFYQNLARYVAAHGAVVLTFDYRGIAASRQGSLRGLRIGIEDWGACDLGGALSLARSEYPSLPMGAIAHSIGALLVGAAPNAAELDHLVLFGPHTGYYGDYGARWRWALYAVWHVIMPAVTKLVGYFPARALGLGEDLPRQVALDWSGRRQPELIAKPEDRGRFGEILASYGKVRARTLAISISDDPFAPVAGGRRLLALYPNIAAAHEVVTPASQERRRLGHFAFLRRPSATYFWDRAVAWILHDVPLGGASRQGASCGVPPSGTKENALAGSTTV